MLNLLLKKEKSWDMPGAHRLCVFCVNRTRRTPMQLPRTAGTNATRICPFTTLRFLRFHSGIAWFRLKKNKCI